MQVNEVIALNLPIWIKSRVHLEYNAPSPSIQPDVLVISLARRKREAIQVVNYIQQSEGQGLIHLACYG